jgi:Glycine-zipper domain
MIKSSKRFSGAICGLLLIAVCTFPPNSLGASEQRISTPAISAIPGSQIAAGSVELFTGQAVEPTKFIGPLAQAYQSYGKPSGSFGEAPSPQRGSRMFIYPSKGQSAQQQQLDQGQCYTWAVQQSGFNPANPPQSSAPPPMAGPPQGGLFRGAAGGAALGAIGGAIGGDAGKGAAMGAAMGGVFGGMRRRRWAQQEQYQQRSYVQREQNAAAQGRRNYNRAFRACMVGRGYTIE